MKKRKIPWCDLYIVKGSELRKVEESKQIGNKIMVNIVRQNHNLKQRIESEIIGLVAKPKRKRR